MTPPDPPSAFSYIRFSSARQSAGDSLRRQVEAAAAWSARRGVPLDDSLTLRDLGVSAYTGGHRSDRHALGAFLAAVKSGRVPRGSYLLVESLDRLSREEAVPALSLLLDLLQSGVRVVQLLPAEVEYDAAANPMSLMLAIAELSRGHSESRVKSQRLGAVWKRKREVDARQGKTSTSRMPNWVRAEGAARVLIPERVAVVRRVFRLAAAGWGMGRIARRFNAEGLATWGGGAAWQQSYVAKILAGRQALGEYQPHTGATGRRSPAGDPIPGYYPACVTEAEWHAAQAGLAARKVRPSGRRPVGPKAPPAPAGAESRRRPNRVYPLSGLLVDGLDGSSLVVVDKGGCGGPGYVNSSSRLGLAGAPYVSFPVSTLEDALFSLLAEVDPSAVSPAGETGAARELAECRDRLAVVAGRLAAVEGELTAGGDVPALAGAARRLEAERAGLAARAAEFEREAATPAAAAWAGGRTLLAAVKGAPDIEAARLRLASVLRRCVAAVTCVIAPRGHDRLVAAQVWFKGDGRRDYLVYHRQSRRLPGRPRVPSSWRAVAVPARSGADLRQPADAAAMLAHLATLDLATAFPDATQ